jgi:hypothetical protein
VAILLRVVVGGLNGHVVLASRTGRRVRHRGHVDDLQTERTIDSRPPNVFADDEDRIIYAKLLAAIHP